MSMFNDTVWNANDENCVSNAEKSKITQRDSLLDIGHFWVQAQKKSGMEMRTTIKKGSGIAQPTRCYSNSKRVVILYLKVSVP